jgi:DNA primase
MVETPLDVRCVRHPAAYGLHEDRQPSLHVYDDPGRGWYCFGCARGGSIYDFAALLFGRGTRGEDFIELRRELAAMIG